MPSEPLERPSQKVGTDLFPLQQRPTSSRLLLDICGDCKANSHTIRECDSTSQIHLLKIWRSRTEVYRSHFVDSLWVQTHHKLP